MTKTLTTIIAVLILTAWMIGCGASLPPPKEVVDNAADLRAQVGQARDDYESVKALALPALSYAAAVPEYARAAELARTALATAPHLLTAADVAVYQYQHLGAAYEDTVRAVLEVEHAVATLHDLVAPLRRAYDAASGAGP